MTTTNPYVSEALVEAYMGAEMTAVQRLRAETDLDALYATIQAWVNRPLVSSTITDERHIAVDEYEPIKFRHPMASITGVRWELLTNPLDTTFNSRWNENIVPRGSIYYVTYVTDASAVAPYVPIIKSIMLDVVTAKLTLPDGVRFGGINSYSVEGLSISYTPPTQVEGKDSVGPLTVGNLNALSRLRRMVSA